MSYCKSWRKNIIYGYVHTRGAQRQSLGDLGGARWVRYIEYSKLSPRLPTSPEPLRWGEEVVLAGNYSNMEQSPLPSEFPEAPVRKIALNI